MPQPELTPRVQRLALVNVCLGQFMSALDSRSVKVALPTLSVYFDVSLAVVQWIPLAYTIDDRRAGVEHGTAGRQVGPEKNLYAGICFARRRFGVLRLERSPLADYRISRRRSGRRCAGLGQRSRDRLDALRARGARPRARHDVHVVSSRLHHRTIDRRLSCRYGRLALDIFYEYAGRGRGGIDGVERSAGDGD